MADRTRRIVVLGLAALVIVATAGNVAHAQTQAAGPYYALPSWDQTLATGVRFIVLTNFNGQAVLDRETGLVWERTPDPARRADLVNASGSCLIESTGGRFGWRLPTAAEFGSLLEAKPGAAFGFVGQLPAGHPFSPGVAGIGVTTYWTSTSLAGGAGIVFEVVQAFANGDVLLNGEDKSFQYRYWCVRAPSSH